MEIFFRSKSTLQQKKKDKEYYILEQKKEITNENLTQCFLKENKIYCIFETITNELNPRYLWQTFFNLGLFCQKNKIQNLILEKKLIDFLNNFCYYKNTLEMAIGEKDINFFIESECNGIKTKTNN
jgi:hypothetical protein